MKSYKKNSFLRDMYYLLKHYLIKNKDICPKCGHSGFLHGFFPEEDCYCSECKLFVN